MQMVQVALERALSAKSYASQFETNCESEPQKAAWSDCLKLFDNTVHQLNRTLQGLDTKHKKNCTNFDAQTWLSAALTNIHTCRDGSKELNVSDFINPIYMSNNNVSELISNSLAIGSQLLEKENQTTTSVGHDDESYPSWLSNHDRRLLGATSIKANLVVAKDGSGHFRTVQAALDLAAKRKRMTRFIIHVKKGVYRENIEVANTNTNIMLVGDSLRYTIITGSRSVKGGYTTYNSATAGIDGPGFIARGITFSNTAGAIKGQAVALRSGSDLSVFYRCAFMGYQDTLMVHSQRQFYRECYIYGTIDFIFGWLEWQRTNFALSTLYYGEYKNFGPASSTRFRVKWPGFHVISSANVATSFTVGNLIAGRSWLPSTSVPFTSGL
ncbi:hypothetical protein ACLB2K_075884 [Fragaria x ananassa]